MTQEKVREHPETVEIDIPARDGTLLHLVMNQEEGTGRFTYSSVVEVQEHTTHGLRPSVTYKAGGILRAPRRTQGFGLHDLEPGLTIERHWMITLSDWIEMFTEASADVWSAEA